MHVSKEKGGTYFGHFDFVWKVLWQIGSYVSIMILCQRQGFTMAENNSVELATPIPVQEPVVQAMRQVVQDIDTVVVLIRLPHLWKNKKHTA